jgi:hypothetical protein
MRAKDIPSVFNPNISLTATGVTFDPSGFEVFPGPNPLKKKSSAFANLGSLQNFPFTNTVNLETQSQKS